MKEQWCEATLPLADSVAPLNPTGGPLALALRTGKAAKRVIKGNPTLRGMAGEIRRRLPSARQHAVASNAS
jgi:CelD/BcsL family acetyltransferase involved in cellulose biosynthesis